MANTLDRRLWANVCETCLQSQNEDFATHGIQAPMLHHGTQSYHLDCLPPEIEDAHRKNHGTAIDAAVAGVRGQELHDVIHKEAEAREKAEAKVLADAEKAEKAGNK